MYTFAVSALLLSSAVQCVLASRVFHIGNCWSYVPECISNSTSEFAAFQSSRMSIGMAVQIADGATHC